MSLSPSGMGVLDRASAEITRCIMRIKKKKDGSSSTSHNNSGSSAQNQQQPQSHNNSACPGGSSKTSSGSSSSTTTTSSSSPQYIHGSPHKSVGPYSFSYSAGNSFMSGSGNNSSSGGSSNNTTVNGSGSNSVHGTPTRNKSSVNSHTNQHPIPMYHLQQYQQHLNLHHQHNTNSYNSQQYNNGSGASISGSSSGPSIIFQSTILNGHGTNGGNNEIGELNMMMDSHFLTYLFKNYFHGLDKLILPLVCRVWRDTTYSLGQRYWNELTPVLNCKEIRHELLNCAGVRRRFYSALHKRGFTGLKLVGATDDDAEDVLIHFSQGANLIQHLKLYNSSLSDKGLYSLLDHLSIVDNLELVSCNEITEDGIIKALPSRLTSVVILDCIHVADSVFSALARHERLHSFTIQAYHVTDSALSSFNSKVNSNLTVLKLNSCWELTNQALLHIVSSLPHLETLSLSGCSKITDEGVEILAENLNALKSLDLSWCSRLTDSCLECIACDLINLEQLVLDRLILITDLGIGYIATMSSLQYLSVRWCSSIRDQSIHHIISIKKLQYLSIAGCTSISPSTLTKLSTLREIRELELTNCGVTASVIQYLRNTLPNCLVIE